MTKVSAHPELAAAELRIRAARVLPPSASADLAIVRGQGAYLWNADGGRFIDHFLSDGATVIGHSDPAVDEAAALAAARCDRTCVGLQPGEVELAERIVASLPSAEKVAFVTSGGDALRCALEIARAATGRRRILTWSGDAATRTVFLGHRHDVAAVVVAPHPDSCLESVRELATRYGSLLVFDERKTAFRHHLGGYQSIVGVAPDLTVLGEAMANGHPIAALAGRADLIDSIACDAVGGETKGPHPAAVAAAGKTLELLESGGVDRLLQLGNRLREGLTRARDEAGADARVTGFGSTWSVSWRRTSAADGFRAAMLAAGILLPTSPGAACHVCVATSTDDLDETIEAAARAFRGSAPSTRDRRRST
ncbi:MAG TPA: aminotransferase class III-fold pyridoxal phosphate-dependent enzyme [Gaiellaceae bacterium]|jgi:glutamate-1-semialdehyde 2,1-aminomutase